jgi:hypothetical protein
MSFRNGVLLYKQLIRPMIDYVSRYGPLARKCPLARQSPLDSQGPLSRQG